ncbi:MAG: alpha/beta hydrolase [Gaiella sp.]
MLAAGLTVAALAGPDGARTAAAAGWERCGSLECRTLRVPLDHAHPARGTLRLEIARIRARDRGRRVGSLVLNPGGPGASGIQLLRSARDFLPDELLERFDIVSFDPRGVGSSGGLGCSVGSDRLYAIDHASQILPPTQIDRQLAQAIAPCLTRHRRTLPHLGTVNTARDLDRIRSLVGDAGLTYLGWSYGTILGAVYAELFPKRVRALVLDGAAPAGVGWREISTRQAGAVERALRTYFAWCTRTGCRLDRPERAWRQAVARLRREPLTLDGRRLYVGHLVSALYASLLSGEAGYSTLSRVIAGVLDGDGRWLAAVADSLGTDEETAALYAIDCADTLERPTTREVLALSDALRKRYPLVGWGLAAACPSGWPLPATQLPDVDGSGSAPILVIGTTGDAATPYVWARRVARELDSGVLLTWRGATHTAFPAGSQCLDGTVVRYLVEAKAPAPRTCGR